VSLAAHYHTTEEDMDSAKIAQKIAEEVRKTLTSGEIPPVARTSREDDTPIPTPDEIWKTIEGRLAETIKPHIDDVYGQGKADGMKESKRKK
jgi:hypothetical protein